MKMLRTGELKQIIRSTAYAPTLEIEITFDGGGFLRMNMPSKAKYELGPVEVEIEIKQVKNAHNV